jgi:hypothetical protein
LLALLPSSVMVDDDHSNFVRKPAPKIKETEEFNLRLSVCAN